MGLSLAKANANSRSKRSRTRCSKSSQSIAARLTPMWTPSMTLRPLLCGSQTLQPLDRLHVALLIGVRKPIDRGVRALLIHPVLRAPLSPCLHLSFVARDQLCVL